MKIFMLGILSFMLTSASFAAEEIKPVVTFSLPMNHSSIHWLATTVRLKVKNIAYEKIVNVVFNQNGQETVIPAGYKGKADGDYEIWQASTNLSKGETSFHLEYEVAGQKYFASNEGADYTLEVGPQLYDGQEFQPVFGAEFLDSYAPFTVYVRESESKDRKLKVHYSFDNFATTLESELSKLSFYQTGYGVLNLPTPQGTEVWSYTLSDIPSGPKEIRYYFSYELDGKTIIDDNYGSYYKLVRYQSPSID